VAPYFLSISPLDVEFIELVFGFDLEAETNRNEVVFEALYGGSPLQALVEEHRDAMLDAQPFIGFSLSQACDVQAFVEVKTRTRAREVAAGRYQNEPISIYLTVRKFGPFSNLKECADSFGLLAGHTERLAEDRVIPHVLLPIREALYSRPM
jgi:hypothetical protein